MWALTGSSETNLRSSTESLVRPAVVTIAGSNAPHVWNGFLFPLILTQSPDKRVLPLSLRAFQDEFTVNIPVILAAVVLSTLLLMVLCALARRRLVSAPTVGFNQ